MDLNMGHLLEAVAAAAPGNEAIVHRDRRYTYAAFLDRCRRLAHVLGAAGLGARADPTTAAPSEAVQDLVLLHMGNAPEYLEGMLGGYLARVAPANVNYRYTAGELAYLLADSAAPAVIVHGRFAAVLQAALDQLPATAPRPRLILQVDDGSDAALVDGAADYATALAAAPGAPVAPVGGPLTPDDLYVVYTGGTTGRPKGVLWRQADFLAGALGLAGTYDDFAAAARTSGPRLRALPAPPLMHGAAHWNAMSCLASGGTIVLQDDPDHLDPSDILDTVERERCTSLLIVGDAFARPILDAQTEKPRDLSTLRHLISGGAILSPAIKRQWVQAVPGLKIVDIMGSSESGRQGLAIGDGTGRFERTPTTAVVSADRTRLLEPGDDEIGWLAKTGPIPHGYLGDPEKTAATFPVIDGVRFVVAGDRGRLLADGAIEMLGRDAATINTGGEKVFAEEVEQVLRAHPAVLDAVVVGRPSEKWGQEVVAVVALRDSAGTVGDDDLRESCAGMLARYKLPKAFVRVDAVGRTPSGKPDYAWAMQVVSGG